MAIEETLITRLKEFIQEETSIKIQTVSISGNMFEIGKESDQEVKHNEIANVEQAK